MAEDELKTLAPSCKPIIVECFIFVVDWCGISGISVLSNHFELVEKYVCKILNVKISIVLFRIFYFVINLHVWMFLFYEDFDGGVSVFCLYVCCSKLN